MSYKKDMSKYEHLEGWERCGFGEQLDKWAEKYGERTAVTDLSLIHISEPTRH